MGVVVAPDGDNVYVTSGRGRMLFAIDTSTYEVLGSVDVGVRPWGAAISADGKTLYTANDPSNDVSVIDADTLRVVTKIPVGVRPWGVVTVP